MRIKNEEQYAEEKTFAQKLCSYTASKDRENSYWYKLADISRSLYHDMSRKGYTPTFRNAVKIALALSLSFDQTTDLLARARLSFSPCFVFDRVIMQFLQSPTYCNPGEYDLSEVDEKLSNEGEYTLFSDK